MIAIKKKKSTYFIELDGKKIASASYYLYSDMDNFDWINIADIDTKKEHRRKGYAYAILSKMISDLDKNYPKMGQYLLVKSDNIPAIRLYQKLGFREIRVITNKKKGIRYSVMTRGNADKQQLMTVDFNTE